MRRWNRWTGLGLVGLALGTGCAQSDGGAQDDSANVTNASAALSGRVLVTFREDARALSPDGLRRRTLARRAHIEGLGGRLVQDLDSIGAVAAELTESQVAALQKDERVAFVEADPIREPIHPVAMKAVTFTAETVPYGIPMVQADQVSDARIANRTVCIVDTGYDTAHPDLRAAGAGRLAGNDSDGKGADTGDWFHDGYGHGTHVAGTISALRGNGIGVVGIAGNNAIGLHIVKVFNDAGTWAYGSDLIVAVDQCIAAGAQVVSMSLGGAARSAAEEAAFDRASQNGVLVIAAAGNGGNTSVSYPAGYGAVASVAAVDANKALAYFSQRNDDVEFAAPGVDVLSTLPGNRYEAWSGTSMATPHVSGVAALVWSHFPACTPAAIRQALAASAQDLGSAGRDASFGYGLVRARAAYDYLATNGCETLPPKPLSFWHAGCAFPAAQSNECHAAIHRYVVHNQRGGAGVAQEVSGGTLAVAAVNPDFYGDIAMSELKAHHAGCQFPAAQSNECVAATHRACNARGYGVGLTQEIGDQRYGVACFHSAWYGDIAMSELRRLHAGCQFPNARSNECVAAIHRACNDRGYSAGLAQEVGNQVYGVACFQTSWYGAASVR